MKTNKEKLIEVLSILKKEGILDNVILIGSWCLLFYQNIFDDFIPDVRTSDIDFYVPNPKSVIAKNNIIHALKEKNFDLLQDCLTNKTVFITPDGFELEFLTKLNRQQLSCVKIGNTGIYSESLSYVEIYSNNYIEIEYEGIKVKVASPASYLLQKLLINDNRKENKKEKDIVSAKNVLPYVKMSKKYNDELQTLYNSLPKKWKNRINKTARENNIEINIINR